jgi:KDO2-lipid IV(A) lauroyltransferase
MPLLPRHDAAFWRSLARWGATKLPRWWLRGSPGPIGLAVGLTQANVRAQIIENLRLVNGGPRPAPIEAIDVAATLANYGHCLAEGLAASGDSPPPFEFTPEGHDNLDRVRAAKRGAVLVTAHVGSWDASGKVMSQRGLDLAIAMTPERDEGARRVSDQARASAGVKVFHVGEDPLSALPLAQHVRNGGAIALQIDRVPPGMRAMPSRLFGRAWPVPLGPFQIAQITGAPVIPVFTARLGFLHHVVHIDPPIEVPRRPKPGELEAVVMQAIGSVERFIRKYPTQWFHFVPHPPVAPHVEALRREAARVWN